LEEEVISDPPYGAIVAAVALMGIACLVLAAFLFA
jgi:hypothetical protein